MDEEAASVYLAASEAAQVVLNGLMEWARDYLTGAERDEAIYHIADMATAYYHLTLAIRDHEGFEL